MIRSADIRKAVSKVIKSALNIEIYFNPVQNSGADYAFVQFKPARRDEGFGAFVRKIKVDISVVLSPNDAALVKHSDLLDAADALDTAFSQYLKINNRYITIYDTSAKIFDSILTYSFDLNFADFIDSLKPDATEYTELMEELYLNMED